MTSKHRQQQIKSTQHYFLSVLFHILLFFLTRFKSFVSVLVVTTSGAGRTRRTETSMLSSVSTPELPLSESPTQKTLSSSLIYRLSKLLHVVYHPAVCSENSDRLKFYHSCFHVDPCENFLFIPSEVKELCERFSTSQKGVTTIVT